MISAIHVERFKCFDAFTLDLAQLTLLTGYNGAGKSSSIQPLLLLSQALREPPLGLVLPLNGSLVETRRRGRCRVDPDGRHSSSWCVHAGRRERVLGVRA